MIKTTDLEELQREAPSMRATFFKGQQRKLPRLRVMSDGYGVIARISNQKKKKKDFLTAESLGSILFRPLPLIHRAYGHGTKPKS